MVLDRFSSASCDDVFEELRRATDKFRVDQQKQLEEFHVRMEGLLVRQRIYFEQGSTHHPVNNSVQGSQATEIRRQTTTYTFDSRETSCLSAQDVPGTPTGAGARAPSSSIVDVKRCVANSEQRTPLYNAVFLSSDELQWWWSIDQMRTFVCRRRLHWDSLRTLVNHKWFVFLVSVVLCWNGLYIGIVTNNHVTRSIDEYSSTEGRKSFVVQAPSWEKHMDIFFTTVFTVEIVMRILGNELAFFFGEEWSWNLLDLLLVVISFIQCAVSSRRLLRMLRALRMLRGLRFSYFRKFRMLVLAIHHSLQPLAWACFLLFLGLYVTSLVFLDGVTAYMASGHADADTVDSLEAYFGTLEETMLTLFLSISGGVSWESLVRTLTKVHVIYGVLFVMYIASMMLAALNIFAGIFVNDAIEMAQNDRDVQLQTEAIRNKAMVKDLKDIFQEFDRDHNGTLTRQEFMDAWRNPEVLVRFRHLGVEPVDGHSLFEMLDISGDDELDIDEFVTMCLRAKTLTRPVDLQSFIQQGRRHNDFVRRQIARLQRSIENRAGNVDSDMGLARGRGDKLGYKTRIPGFQSGQRRESLNSATFEETLTMRLQTQPPIVM